MDQAEGIRRLIANPQARTAKTAPPQGARVIAITSGKGGVGKTHLAVNLGLALVQRGLNVGLLDADLGLANVDILLGIVPRYTISDIVFGKKALDDIVLRGPSGLLIFPGGTGISELADVTEWQLDRFLSAMSTLDSRLDILLVDTAAGIGRGVTSFLHSAKELIVVTTPEPTSITDAYALIKNVGINQPDTRMHLVVNKVRTASEAESVCRNLNLVLRRFADHPVSLELLGHITFDPSVTRAIMDQVPLVMAQPTGATAQSIFKIADALRGHEPLKGGGIGHLFQTMVTRLRSSRRRS